MVGSCKQSGSSLGIKRITCWVQPGVLGTWVGGHFPVFFSALVGLPGFGEVLCTPSLLGCSQHSGCQHLPQLSALWEAGLDSSVHTGNGHTAGAEGQPNHFGSVSVWESDFRLTSSLCPYPLKSLHCYKECSFNGLSMLHYYDDEDGDKDDDMMMVEMEAFLRKLQKGQEPGHRALCLSSLSGKDQEEAQPSKPCSLLSKVAATQAWGLESRSLAPHKSHSSTHS